jgi:hypothetical protein
LHRIRTFAACGGLIVCLLGCASWSDSGPTAAQRDLHRQTERFNGTVTTGAASGAAIGAAGGAIVAAALGGNDIGVSLLGGAIGAVVGGLIGGSAAWYIAERNERYSDREQQARRRERAARREVEDLTRTAALAEQVALENQAKLGEIERMLAARRVTREAYQRDLLTMQDDLASMRQAAGHGEMLERTLRQDGYSGEAESIAAARRRLLESARRLQEALANAPTA